MLSDTDFTCPIMLLNWESDLQLYKPAIAQTSWEEIPQKEVMLMGEIPTNIHCHLKLFSFMFPVIQIFLFKGINYEELKLGKKAEFYKFLPISTSNKCPRL